MTTVTVADLKSHLSGLLGRVMHNRETLVVTRHGKTVARISPAGEKMRRRPAKGWLADDDPFFRHLADIVRARTAHTPRVGR